MKNKLAFLIGVNDVGGAEYVSYQHVLMAKRAGINIVVLSGTDGYFANKIKEAGVRIEHITMNPQVHQIARLIQDCDVLFNCNNFVITPIIAQLRKTLEFRYYTIIHCNIEWVYEQLSRYDSITDKYYAIHQKIADEWIEKGKIKKEKITVIPNCVDSKLITNSGIRELSRKELGYKKDDFVIGMITRINRDKNVKDAARILSKLPAKYKLLIIGGALYENGKRYYHEFIDIIKSLQLLDRVKITGNLIQEDVYRLLYAFDIGLNCSPSEGLPIALLEMMSAGIPCVMPSIGEIPEVLTGNGIVVPIRQRITTNDIIKEPNYEEHEISRFANAVYSLATDKEQLLKYGQSARNFIIKNRDLKIQKKQFLKFINTDKDGRN